MEVPPAIILCSGLEWQVVLDAYAPHRAAPAYKSQSGYTRVDTLDDDVLCPALSSWVNIVERRSRLVGIASGHADNRWSIVSLADVNHTNRICISCCCVPLFGLSLYPCVYSVYHCTPVFTPFIIVPLCLLRLFIT